ncbi:MAG: glycoside hydrolase family 44 protein [Chthoniobacterales bacterium]
MNGRTGAAARVAIAIATLTSAITTLAQNPGVTINVDAAANRHAINPNIYGVAYATTTQLNDLNAPLNRNGGNNTSRYNWLQNADNRAQDWYFESIGDTSAVAGERGDTFIANAKAANAQAMLTIPLLDWVAKLGTNRSKLAGFSIAKYGPQTGNDWQWFPDAGNGILSSGGYVIGNDPNDANVSSSSAFQQSWVQHVVSAWGTNANGGLRYYLLDNEPSIWHSTHRDVHPTGLTMDQMLAKILDYAGMIKNNDATALLVGPEEWGWSGYFYSGYDQQYGAAHGWGYLPDRAAHNGADYLPWLLDQLHQNELSSGRRLLDIFTVHYYPQGGEFSDDVSTAMQLRRNRSTRSLWDPNYIDETWINDRVQLVPRIKSWISTYYPGTLTGLTEYNWGAEGHINGATTQADIYGIFGREAVDLATRWTTPDPSTPTYKAMKLYRNYDGNKSGFGDTSVLTTAAQPDNVSAFSALRSSDNALTVMVVAKYLSGTTPVTINVANYAHGSTAQVWQLTAANTITHLSDASFNGNNLSATVPQQSVT